MSGPEREAYVFIPGKNWKLSLAELLTLFQTRKIAFRVSGVTKAFFVISTETPLDSRIIDELGGTIKMGKLVSRLPSATVEDAFVGRDKLSRAKIKEALSVDCSASEIFKVAQKRCVFGVSLYFQNPRLLRPSKDLQRFVGSHFKDQLAALGVRARFMGFPKGRRLPQLTHVEVLKKGLIESSAEILVCIDQDQTYVAGTMAVHDPFEFQKRDVQRPVQRRIFSIPPRLAKIMVNLAGCYSERVFLDPFCGVGTILQEAALTRAQVIGMDVDPWCVEASRTNLGWLRVEYGLEELECSVKVGDARHLTGQIPKESVDCIATEPDLGPALRQLPTASYARRIVEKLTPLFHDFLEEAHKVLKTEGRLVLVTPYIRTRSESFVTMDLQEKAGAIGFKTIMPIRKEVFAHDVPVAEDLTRTSSFIEAEERHKTGREIHILQKRN